MYYSLWKMIVDAKFDNTVDIASYLPSLFKYNTMQIAS